MLRSHLTIFIGKLSKVLNPVDKTQGSAFNKFTTFDDNEDIINDFSDSKRYHFSTGSEKLMYAWSLALKNQSSKALKIAKNAIDQATRLLEDSDYIANNKNLKLENFILASAHALRAEIFLQQGKIEDASKSVKKALEADSSYEPAYVIQAQIYLKENKLREALNACFKAKEINKTYEPAYVVASIVYNQAGKPDSAIIVIQNLIDSVKNFNNPFVYAIQSDAYAHLGDISGCLTAASSAYSFILAAKKNSLSEQQTEYINSLSKKSIQQLEALYNLRTAISEFEEYKDVLIEEKLPARKEKEPYERNKQLKLNAFSQLQKDLEDPLKEILKNNTKEAKNKLLKVLHSQDKVLGKSRGFSKIVKNIALAISLLGVGYVVAGLIHLAATRGKHFAFFDTTSIKKVDKIEKRIAQLHKLNK